MRVTAEIPYGHIERSASGLEEPCQSWVDLSGMSRDSGLPYGLSLLNDGKYSYDVNIRDLGLTVLRSPIYAHHMPFAPDPDGGYAIIDQGLQEFHYTLLPHTDRWEDAGTVRRAAELNVRPIPLVATFHPAGTLPQSMSFLSVDRENVIATVLKQAEGGEDLVVRCVETQNRPCRHLRSPSGAGHQADFSLAGSRPSPPKDPTQPLVETTCLNGQRNNSEEGHASPWLRLAVGKQ
jgi:alpha-mannosidase